MINMLLYPLISILLTLTTTSATPQPNNTSPAPENPSPRTGKVYRTFFPATQPWAINGILWSDCAIALSALQSYQFPGAGGPADRGIYWSRIPSRRGAVRALLPFRFEFGEPAPPLTSLFPSLPFTCSPSHFPPYSSTHPPLLYPPARPRTAKFKPHSLTSCPPSNSGSCTIALDNRFESRYRAAGYDLTSTPEIKNFEKVTNSERERILRVQKIAEDLVFPVNAGDDWKMPVATATGRDNRALGMRFSPDGRRGGGRGFARYLLTDE